MKTQIKGNLIRFSLNRKQLITRHHAEDNRGLFIRIECILDLSYMVTLLDVVINQTYQRTCILARMTKYEDSV